MFPLYASQRRGQEPTEGEWAALAVCERCPVLAPCREAVLTVSPLTHGVAGGMTAMQRREARAIRRGLTGSTAGSPTPAAPIAPAVAEVLAVQTGAGARTADPVTVDQLAAGHSPTTASRWEVALAAAAMLTSGAPLVQVARSLGEQPRQVHRWRDRYTAGEPLVPACRGVVVGTEQLHRPGRQRVSGRRVTASAGSAA